jgi:hypothetical protein
MAEEFEGPVVVKRPTGQPPNFEVAKFDGAVRLDSNAFVGGTVAARGNVDSEGGVNTGFVKLFGNVQISGEGGAGVIGVTCVLDCQADDTLSVKHLRAEGDVNANNVNANNVNANNVNANNVNANNVNANNVNANNVKVEGTVNTQDLRAEGNISALNNVNAKNVHVEEDIILSNSDCAEEFDLEDSSMGEPLPGSVMVIGDEGSVRLSTSAYDKRVAGVISGAGAFKPGIILDRQNSDCRRLAVALMGKVFCKVDAEYSPVEVGDLLTTSSTPGHAMKAADPFKAFGAVLGKALRPLKEGQGLIPVLVALQ